MAKFLKPTPIRDGFGRALIALGESDKRVVALTADLSSSIRVHWFAERFPDRFFQMGVAESDMMGTAAGMALGGLIPFATTFAVFATSLANQTVRLSIAYNRANVKIAASHGGITVGPDGATHQAFEDIALMRVIPDMMVVVPCDANEAYDATEAIAAYDGPVYLRMGRGTAPICRERTEKFELGRAFVLREGGDVALFTCGEMVHLALASAKVLASDGISAAVVNVPTVKPLDHDTVRQVAAICGACVSVEEHSVLGGLGSAIAESLSQQLPSPQEYVGVQDSFGESGEAQEILEAYGLSIPAVVCAAKLAIVRKNA